VPVTVSPVSQTYHNHLGDLTVKIYDETNTPWDSLSKHLTMGAYLKKFHPTEKLTHSDIATLVLADNLEKIRTEFGDAFGHEICMGIRMGLFGSHADHSTSLLDLEIRSQED
jgi:hypothetical protein